MGTKYKILIMGASYGSLLGTKLALAGHAVHLICLPAEADLINNEGAIVRMPVKGRDGLVEINSKKLPGKLTADGPGAVNPADYDLVALAMQEPQYRAPGVRELLHAVAKAKVPCMSIMNMPPLPYLKRIPGLATDTLRSCYTDATVWEDFDPRLMTLCSPDPQAIRPPNEKINVLQVTLPTNFKVARFDSNEYTAMLRQMAADIEAIRYDCDGSKIELPVKLRVCELCVKLGASPNDLVPFEKYAAAAQSLVRPSSAARALFAGAPNIERTDRLVQTIAAQYGMRNTVVDQTVAVVDARIAANRKVAA